jgi:hypothetical protein
MPRRFWLDDIAPLVGTARLEVLGLAADRDLIRSLAKRLWEDKTCPICPKQMKELMADPYSALACRRQLNWNAHQIRRSN